MPYEPDEDVAETFFPALERVIKRLAREAQANAERRHRELMAAIKKEVSDTTKLEAINRGLADVADRLDAINASDKRAIPPV